MVLSIPLLLLAAFVLACADGHEDGNRANNAKGDDGTCGGDGTCSNIGRAEAHVISLDPEHTDRYGAFQTRNPHLQDPSSLHTRHAVDGRIVDLNDAVATGVVHPNLVGSQVQPSPADVGTAISHAWVWRRIAQRDDNSGPVLVLEDDVFTHPQIMEYAASHASELLKADITLCSVRQDWALVHTDARGRTIASATSPETPTIEWIDKALNATNLASVESNRLTFAAGTSCYWLSPRGARKLLGDSEGEKGLAVLPLRLDHVFRYNPASSYDGWPPLGKPNAMLAFHPLKGLAQNTLWRRLNHLYDSLDARVLDPPLAYTTKNPVPKQPPRILPGEKVTRQDIMEILAGARGGPPSPGGMLNSSMVSDGRTFKIMKTI